MPLTMDWTHLQAAITEYADVPVAEARNMVVLSLPVSGSTARASTAVAASLLRGLVNEYFESYEIPVGAQWAQITNTGISQGPTGYSLAVYLGASGPEAFVEHAAHIRTALEQALEDLPKYLMSPDPETQAIIDALGRSERLDAEPVE